jgi:hypothetical protein
MNARLTWQSAINAQVATISIHPLCAPNAPPSAWCANLVHTAASAPPDMTASMMQMGIRYASSTGGSGSSSSSAPSSASSWWVWMIICRFAGLVGAQQVEGRGWKQGSTIWNERENRNYWEQHQGMTQQLLISCFIFLYHPKSKIFLINFL